MDICIIGAGNVAWHLAKGLEESGHNITEVYARKRKKARELASLLYDSESTNSLNLSDSDAVVFIVAVSDNAIVEVARNIELPHESLLLHTSGSIPMEVLELARKKNEALQIGVLYPLMTFTKGIKVQLSTIPFLIEGSDEKAVMKLAKSLSQKCSFADSLQRQTLHASAVFACNFTNHLLALAKELTETEEADFELLKPLISETFQKSLSSEHPADVQTGPAVRNDTQALQTHREILKHQDDLLRIYDEITRSIQYWHLE